ncbi:hypothetical protein NCAS_0G02410 [Naumovozyma castellii]|uniref:Factor arrest protein 11 n=1 Tax=Naumovozyma castellii TaxID=27288 RepID=G0VI93_NAUCA|nr:hypothetical protein NCAS_0G02410 [Naumovozyma castellii CBS 4309]CCC71128.1 hypothetical protein NCAS_0G02410 [Naumovozyma castellii CBS 4309]
MKAGQGRDVPIINRSMSLDDIKHKRTPPQFIDDMAAHRTSNSAQERNEILLKDLDIMLKNKLNVVNGLRNQSPNSTATRRSASYDDLNGSFRQRSGLEGDIITRSPPGLDYEDDALLADNATELDGGRSDNLYQGNLDMPEEDEDDEEFANVDEVDGPLLGHLQEKTDKNNDLKDYNMPINEDLKKDLENRAAELAEGNGFQPVIQKKVEWSFKDFTSLNSELDDWFCAADYALLSPSKNQFMKKDINEEQFMSDDVYAEKITKSLLDLLPQDIGGNLLSLFYISMGIFGKAKSMNDHLTYIRRNTMFMIPQLPILIKTFKEICISCRDNKNNLKRQSTFLFYSSSILFLIATICIESRDGKSSEFIQTVIHFFDDDAVLQFLTKYIEHWRWNSRLSMRVRNIISLLFKLITLQFGDRSLYTTTKKQLYNFHGLNAYNNDEEGKRLTVSPLHYKAFQEDITSRFPEYPMPTPHEELPKDIDDSTSLSQFLEIPRSKARNPMNLNLAVPEQHIATPAPSPPASPELTSSLVESPRLRKSFQTNMAYPCLYPSDDDLDLDALNKRISSKKCDEDVKVPFSIEEAATILSSNLKVKLSTRQLWSERELFMVTERGWQSSIPSDPYNYPEMKNPTDAECINIMKRIDTYYRDCLPNLNSLVFVLLQTMESNLNNIVYKRSTISEDANVETLKPYLEIMKAKETALRTSTGILYLLLKWFKLNHILKFEQFSVLLYDSRYINTCTSILNKYSESYSSRIFNEILTTDESIWKVCSQHNAAYEQDYKISFGNVTDQDTSLLPSFAYMLRILRKMIDNKTQRLKELPLPIGLIFKKYYKLYNLDIYHPILRIIRELTPFKNKRWKSEHMELISGVYLYERLELIDNWVTGKDIAGEINDACGQEIALRALLQFYNFRRYETSMTQLGYTTRDRDRDLT